MNVAVCPLCLLPVTCRYQQYVVWSCHVVVSCLIRQRACRQSVQLCSCNHPHGRQSAASSLHSKQQFLSLSSWLCAIAAQLAGRLPIYENLVCRQQARPLDSPRRQLLVAEGAQSSSVQPSGPVLAPAGCPALPD